MNIKLSYHWAAAALLAIATGCSNDNITPETKPDSGKPETTQVSFIAGNEGTRTSLNYGSGDFYWVSPKTQLQVYTLKHIIS